MISLPDGANVATPYGDLTDLTYILVIEPGDTEADIVEAVGFSPSSNKSSGDTIGLHPESETE